MYVTRRCALLSSCRRSPFLRVLEIREPSKVEDTSTVLVRALVERATVAEAIKASFGYEVCVHPRGLSFGEESIAKLRARSSASGYVPAALRATAPPQSPRRRWRCKWRARQARPRHPCRPSWAEVSFSWRTEPFTSLSCGQLWPLGGALTPESALGSCDCRGKDLKSKSLTHSEPCLDRSEVRCQ